MDSENFLKVLNSLCRQLLIYYKPISTLVIKGMVLWLTDISANTTTAIQEPNNLFLQIDYTSSQSGHVPGRKAIHG